jgi:hypothetical protein
VQTDVPYWKQELSVHRETVFPSRSNPGSSSSQGSCGRPSHPQDVSVAWHSPLALAVVESMWLLTMVSLPKLNRRGWGVGQSDMTARVLPGRGDRLRKKGFPFSTNGERTEETNVATSYVLKGSVCLGPSV